MLRLISLSEACLEILPLIIDYSVTDSFLHPLNQYNPCESSVAFYLVVLSG